MLQEKKVLISFVICLSISCVNRGGSNDGDRCDSGTEDPLGNCLDKPKNPSDDATPAGGIVRGNEHGNGGDAVVCLDGAGNIQSVELFDYFEARELYGQSPDLGDDALDEWEKASLVFGRLQRLSPKRVANYQQTLTAFPENMRLIENAHIVDVDDTNSVIIPSECQMRQAAVYRDEALGHQYFIDKSIWEEMDANQRAGLIVHEILNHEFHSGQDSANTRKFHMLLADPTLGLASMTTPEFVKMLQRLGGAWIDIGDLTFDIEVGQHPASVSFPSDEEAIGFHPGSNRVAFGYLFRDTQQTIKIANARNTFVKFRSPKTFRQKMFLTEEGIARHVAFFGSATLIYSGEELIFEVGSEPDPGSVSQMPDVSLELPDDFFPLALGIRSPAVNEGGYLSLAKFSDFHADDGNPFTIRGSGSSALTVLGDGPVAFALRPTISGCERCGGTIHHEGESLAIADESAFVWVGNHVRFLPKAHFEAELPDDQGTVSLSPAVTELQGGLLVSGVVAGPTTYVAKLGGGDSEFYQTQITVTGRIEFLSHGLHFDFEGSSRALGTLSEDTNFSSHFGFRFGARAGCTIFSNEEVTPEFLPDGRPCRVTEPF